MDSRPIRGPHLSELNKFKAADGTISVATGPGNGITKVFVPTGAGLNMEMAHMGQRTLQGVRLFLELPKPSENPSPSFLDVHERTSKTRSLGRGYLPSEAAKQALSSPSPIQKLALGNSPL